MILLFALRDPWSIDCTSEGASKCEGDEIKLERKMDQSVVIRSTEFAP